MLTFMTPEPVPRMMKNFPVGAGLPAIAAPAAEQTPIRGQGRSYRKPCIFLLFHANFHDAYRHTPNDEKSAGFRVGFETRPETVLRSNVCDFCTLTDMTL